MAKETTVAMMPAFSLPSQPTPFAYRSVVYLATPTVMYILFQR